MEHICVKFGDPSCIGFEISCGKKTDRRTIGGKCPTPTTDDGEGNDQAEMLPEVSMHSAVIFQLNEERWSVNFATVRRSDFRIHCVIGWSWSILLLRYRAVQRKRENGEVYRRDGMRAA